MTEFRLGRLTWPELKDTIDKVDAILVPVGATEQHARHMPLDNDYSTSVATCERVAIKAQEAGLNVLVSPPVTFGASWYHMDFPGTITLSQTTFMSIIKEICISLNKHGFRNIIFFNSHGGNTQALTLAMTELYEKTRIRTYLCQWFDLCAKTLKERGIKTPLLHSEEAETSLAFALGQRVVTQELKRETFSRKETLDKKGMPTSKHVNYDKINPGSGVLTPIDYIIDISDSGVVGDATLASKETGEAMLKEIVTIVLELIKDLNRLNHASNITTA